MNYKPALWDGSEPLYAPNKQNNKNGSYWRPSAKFRNAGYSIKSYRLRGTELEMAQKCRELTREAIKWFDGDRGAPTPDTMKFFIAKYTGDKYSPFHKVKGSTLRGYLQNLKIIENSMGSMRVAGMDYPFFAMVEQKMRDKGRSAHYIHKIFTMLRMVVKYNSIIGDADAMRMTGILSAMRIQMPPKRTVAPTRAQILPIIQAADDAGDHMFALGLSLQWWFALRAIDVRGQWLPGEGGIQHEGNRWQDGLTWNMVDKDLLAIRKVLSKTAKSMPDETVFGLSALPDLQSRFRAIPKAQRAGPVIIKQNTGLPYSTHSWSRAFRKYRDAAGVSSEIRMMDVRAGAITEASEMGAAPFDMRDAAGHSQITTTDRYARGKAAAISRVLELRVKNS